MAGEKEAIAFADVVEDRLGYVLRRASSGMMSELGAVLARVGLRPVEATILLLIGAREGSTQSEIGRTLGIKRANMVPLIAGLTAKGLVEKSPVDGRSQGLSLTVTGIVSRDAADAAMQAHERRFQSLLSETEVKMLRDVLGRIVREIGQSPD